MTLLLNFRYANKRERRDERIAIRIEQLFPVRIEHYLFLGIAGEVYCRVCFLRPDRFNSCLTKTNVEGVGRDIDQSEMDFHFIEGGQPSVSGAYSVVTHLRAMFEDIYDALMTPAQPTLIMCRRI